MFDTEDIKKFKSLPRETMLQSLKSCFVELFIQVGEAAEDGGDAKNYIKWLQDSLLDAKQQKSELKEALERSTALMNTHAETFDLIRENVKELLILSTSPDAVVEAEDKDKGRSTDAICMNEFLQSTFANDGTLVCSRHSSHCCESCGSLSTVPRPLISHSASVESLIHLFKYQLPDLSDLSLLDIGSGLGSVLYGAYYFSRAAHITGIELNETFQHVVSKITDKYNLHDRVRIIYGDLMDHVELVSSSDVIIFNNVLEYFTPIDVQLRIWTFLRDNIRPGAILVTNPDLHTLLRPLGIEKLITSWVQPMESRVDQSILLGLPDTDEVFCLYKVISDKC